MNGKSVRGHYLITECWRRRSEEEFPNYVLSFPFPNDFLLIQTGKINILNTKDTGGMVTASYQQSLKQPYYTMAMKMRASGLSTAL